MPKAGKFWVSEPEAYLEPRGEGICGVGGYFCSEKDLSSIKMKTSKQ